MAENTNIEWCDHTFNPWFGCTKVSPGCDHCYAEARMDTRLHRANWGPGQPRVRTQTWGDPKKWNKRHAAFFAEHGRRQRVFCASLADVFDNEVDPQWRADLFDLIAKTPNLDWLLLTKRIGNAKTMMADALHLQPEANRDGMIWPLPNVWIGATIVNQAEADRDIPKLLQVPAAKRFLSMEPLLGPVKLPRFCACGCNKPLEQAVDEAMDGPSALNEFQARASIKTTVGIDWVIVGGESGPGARPMHPDWARSLRDQCQAAGVSFLFKQWGEYAPGTEGFARNGDVVHEHGVWSVRVGKKAAGRLLDGRTWDGFPT